MSLDGQVISVRVMVNVRTGPKKMANWLFVFAVNLVDAIVAVWFVAKCNNWLMLTLISMSTTLQMMGMILHRHCLGGTL